jgi:exonuclease III
VHIVSWNLAGNTVSRRPATHDRAWHYLAALDADVLLVQEATPPAWVRDRWAIVMAPVKRWGSAILAKRGLQLTADPRPAESIWERDGYIASGSVMLTDGTPLFLGSVHAPLMNELEPEFLAGYEPAAIKLPSYPVAYYYDVPYAIYRGRVPARFLVSGDWNVSPTLWDLHHKNSHEGEFFDRARRDKWVDVYRYFHADEGQTWFRKTDRPYQLDHGFCDPTTALALKACDIDPYPAATLMVSDHAPLLIELA